MKEYNTAFFSLYENWFKLLKTELGEDKAIELFRKAMEMGLSKAYGNSFTKGLTSENEVTRQKLDDTYIAILLT